MNRRLLAAAMATSLSLLTAQTVFAAQPLEGHSSVSEKGPRQKNINFHLRNDTKADIVIKAGEQELTVKPGETTALKVPAGQQIVSVNGTATIAPGTVLAMVSANLDGSTLAVR